MTLRELAIAVGFEIDPQSESMVDSSINRIKGLASKALGAIGIGFSIAGLSNLAEAAADVKALESQFTQVFGGLEDEATQKLNAIADETGVMADRMKGSFTQIAAFAKTTGMDEKNALDLTNRSLKAVTDSSAYYDKSIEEMTEHLQSLLKGNYENDAALGFSCTETTRNAAANKLYGKSFKDLAEDQKQLTLLSMVEDANKASGALGQAARESDTWTNQLGNLQQSVKNLKAAAGQGFLQPAVNVLKLLNSLLQKGTEQVAKFTREGGPMQNRLEKIYATASKFKPFVQSGIRFIGDVINKLGGLGNVLKVTAFLLTTAFAFKNAGKVVTLLNTIKKAITAINMKTMATIAILLLIFLLVDDFINFMKGNDSVIGTILEKAGIDTEKTRDKIKSAFGVVKTFLVTTFKVIATVCKTVFGGLVNFFSQNGSSILGILKGIWTIIWTLLKGIFTIISEDAKKIFGDLKSFWDTWGSAIISQFQLTFNFLMNIISIFLSFLSHLIGFIAGVFTGDWSAAWENIKGIFSDAWNAIKNTATYIWSSVSGFIGSAIDAMKTKIFGWYDTIKEKVVGAANFITGLLGMGGGIDLGVSASTAGAATGGSGAGNKNIKQSNTIINNFNGGNAYDQNRAAGAMSKSGEDITDSLKRSMAYS